MKDHFENVRQKVGADENVAQQLLFVNSTTLNSNWRYLPLTVDRFGHVREGVAMS